MVRHHKSGSTQRILEQLHRQKAMTAEQLSGELDITGSAVRQQLARLVSAGLVRVTSQHGGVGRPRNLYRLTEEGRKYFAQQDGLLAKALLDEMHQLYGKEAAFHLLERAGKRLYADLQGSIDGDTLVERVRQLADHLNGEGVITDVRVEMGYQVLSLYNCPYHEVAQAHRGLCLVEARTLADILDAEVKQSKCMMDGANGCQFIIKEKKMEEVLV